MSGAPHLRCVSATPGPHAMSTDPSLINAIRYLRMSLHLPGGGRRGIGHLSQYGDILRVSFDADYIADPARPTLSLAFPRRRRSGHAGDLVVGPRRAALAQRRPLARLVPEPAARGPQPRPAGSPARLRGRRRIRVAGRCRPRPDGRAGSGAGTRGRGHSGHRAPLAHRARTRRAGARLRRNAGGRRGLAARRGHQVFRAVQDGRRYAVKKHGAAGSFHPQAALDPPPPIGGKTKLRATACAVRWGSIAPRQPSSPAPMPTCPKWCLSTTCWPCADSTERRMAAASTWKSSPRCCSTRRARNTAAA